MEPEQTPQPIDIVTLQEKVDELQAKLDAKEAAEKRQKELLQSGSWWITRFLTRLFFGRSLQRQFVVTWDAYQEWGNRKRDWPSNETRDLSAAVLGRFMRVSVLGLVIALLPTAFLIMQTIYMGRQTTLIEIQQAQIERSNAYTAFENTSRFRELLADNPTNEEQGYNEVVVQQLKLLADQDKETVVEALMPLLRDRNSRVVNGALMILLEKDESIKYKLIEGGDVRYLPFIFPTIFNVNLNNANLRGVSLNNVTLYEANLSNADLRTSDLNGAKLPRADFSKANLQNANLKGASLVGADFSKASLREANLRDATLAGVDLSSADLSGALLNNAILSYSVLSHSELRGTNLIHTDLSKVDLKHVSFLNADLSNANLWKADLRNAYLTNVQHWGTDYSYANLAGICSWRYISDFTFVNIYNVKNPPDGFIDLALSKGAVWMDIHEWREFSHQNYATY